MSEWWTYELSDFLMFSARTWQRTLALHNADWFPLQALGTAAALCLLWLPRSGAQWAARVALLIAAAAWAFTGWAFHWQRFAPINWAAAYFAIGFAVQALVLVWLAFRRGPLLLSQDGGPGTTGAVLVAIATLYPLVALVLGRPAAQTEWFALMPDPTVLGTLGLLLCLRGGRPLVAMALPLPWCAIGGATLWTLKSPEWFVLPLAGLIALAAAITARRARPP